MSKATVPTNTNINLDHPDHFVRRHIGPNPHEQHEMLKVLGHQSLDELIDATVPKTIRFNRALNLPAAQHETEALAQIRTLAAKNKVFKSYIGQGYYGTITPPVIQRNILENPGWYTQYTPYQAEIAQGRLESLLNFQTMVEDLTALPIANASLLDEATAAAEAMHMAYSLKGSDAKNAFFVSELCHPQTIDVVKTRALPLGIEVVVSDHRNSPNLANAFGALVQYPATNGAIFDYRDFIKAAHAAGAIVVMATDLLALTLITPPGELGADIAIGSAQRFGVPLGFGGPHAAFMSCKDEYKRSLPGRLVGVSKDSHGRPAFRLSLQTREQHIRREKATSNICTAQALLANMAAMYAVYHGPEGLKATAQRVHNLTAILHASLTEQGIDCLEEPFFDTITVRTKDAKSLLQKATSHGINLRLIDDNTIGISFDETTDIGDLEKLQKLFGNQSAIRIPQSAISAFSRATPFLQHAIFNTHHSETEILRYIKLLESRDLSLAHSMIPLGSCTMKLNATAEMFPVSWPEFSAMHPFAPADQTAGYRELFKNLEDWLAEITGFHAVSLQPNAGSQGEYAGLLAIYHYNRSRGQGERNICLIPTSAHGTNPASAVMAGFVVQPVACDSNGNIDVADLRAKAAEHAPKLAALMITYPSTHGVFEETVKEICDIIHQNGGQVYMDGANMNAQVGLCRPGDLGADVCHLNLHKTFCIPHGGGGPGMGPIGVAKHLAQFLPHHPVFSSPSVSSCSTSSSVGAVSAAPWGSASILPISWMYIAMMGPDGLKQATEVAILNANYIAKRLENAFPVLYKGRSGRVAHECILDLRGFKSITVEDVAKRLMDYGFHAPTISWPVPGTVMIEPTESESKAELDRFCDAMLAIHSEIKAIESGRADKTNNVLKNAPHTAEALISDKWDRPYPREQAAYPAPWLRQQKFWPAVGRIDNVFGDRNLICSCIGMEAFTPKN